MTDYIVCHKKRNSPRLNVRICEEKCASKPVCKDYLALVKPPITQEQLPVPQEGLSLYPPQ
jgi:hypothetical protein